MAKAANLVPTEQITVSVTPHVVKQLESLVLTGYYGKNVAEAAERLLSRVLEDRSKESLASSATSEFSSSERR